MFQEGAPLISVKVANWANIYRGCSKGNLDIAMEAERCSLIEKLQRPEKI